MSDSTPNIKHSVPEEHRSKAEESTKILTALYNELNDMSIERFEKNFASTLEDIHSYSDTYPDANLLFFVLGATIAAEDDLEDGNLIGHTSTKFVFELGDEEFIDHYHHTPDTIDDTDYFFLVTIRPQDCPPGTGTPATDITLEEYHDIMATALYKRFELFQNDMERYKKICLQPILTPLEDYTTDPKQ